MSRRGFDRILILGALLAAGTTAAAEIRVHGPEQVLTERTSRSLTGALLFRDANGAFVRLVTSTDDPVISNRGDGTFHPVQVADVEAAIAAIPQPFTSPLDIDIFVLPYPRATCLDSSADSRAIYLSPGVYAYTDPAEVHALVAHELGHAVHRLFLPDSDTAGWKTYLGLRGVGSDPRYHADAAHAFRPHELFAEDFRVLFGGALASANSRVENPEMSEPDLVPGLRSFIGGLAGVSDPAAIAENHTQSAAPIAWPNPVRQGETFHLAIDSPARRGIASLHDATGREVARAAIDGTSASQLDLTVEDLAVGAYWVRIDTGHGTPRSVAIRVVR